ncbi:cytadherence high molecular weight protein 2-like [Bactrocera tryoni]|uniref:cytadherence high molecular weight protein 2-like n=1 Tax=Bactrocera tryoni TaxID=59916 RepID=UPI001A9740EA|nr:cytadherence high molecular weight protein 2-like [Bactrocera tryoni]
MTTLDVKSSFLKDHMLKLQEVAKRQSDYRRALAARLQNFRRNQIMEGNLKKGTAKLLKEKADIKVKVWTAIGTQYKRKSAGYLGTIKCHITCEEKLAEDIHNMKTSILNIQRELGRLSRHIYDLNRHTIPATRAIEDKNRARKHLAMKENQLEVGIHQECKMTALNMKLREELHELILERKAFNEHYFKLIRELNSDKKYMTDLIGYAMHQFDSSIDLYERFDIFKKRQRRDLEQRRMEMRDISRNKTESVNDTEFYKSKIFHRRLADLQPKEYRRRSNMRERMKKKLIVNKNVLHKIFQYTGQKNIKTVITKFKEQESLYYSYFNYANETSYHMTLLNNAVNRLYADIDMLKLDNRNSMQNQVDQIEKLESQLQEIHKNNEVLRKSSVVNDERLNKLFLGLKLVRDHSKTNWQSLEKEIGDYRQINLTNLHDQLKLVEKRIFGVLATVYRLERKNVKKRPINYLIKNIEKFCDFATNLNDIVITQQCPECAEVDALNIDETESVGISSIENAKHKLYDKITQPEMQYRLHSISSCRFPRARMLTAKRNMENDLTII